MTIAFNNDDRRTINIFKTEAQHLMNSAESLLTSMLDGIDIPVGNNIPNRLQAVPEDSYLNLINRYLFNKPEGHVYSAQYHTEIITALLWIPLSKEYGEDFIYNTANDFSKIKFPSKPEAGDCFAEIHKDDLPRFLLALLAGPKGRSDVQLKASLKNIFHSLLEISISRYIAMELREFKKTLPRSLGEAMEEGDMYLDIIALYSVQTIIKGEDKVITDSIALRLIATLDQTIEQISGIVPANTTIH